MIDKLQLQMADPFGALEFTVLQPSPEMEGWVEVKVSEKRGDAVLGVMTVRDGEYGIGIEAMLGESVHDLSDVLGWYVADYWRKRATEGKR